MTQTAQPLRGVPGSVSETSSPTRRGPSAVFYASIYGLGGKLLGHLPICERQAGDFEPLVPPDFDVALALDGAA